MSDRWTKRDAARLARTLVHTAPEAALGTLAAQGGPHVSHVSSATMIDGAPVVLVSQLALHTQNIARDGRASLMFVAPLAGLDDNNARARVTLDGTLAPVPDAALARSRFLRRHPAAEMYVDFGDFAFMALAVADAHLVAGFGRITALEPGDILAPADMAAALGEVDVSACTHMDEDHADALELIATRLGGGPADGAWRSVGIDPLGIDLGAGGAVVRAEWDTPVASSGALRAALVAMTKAARG
ncbi:DUF2470 domain-containing protein [Acuticoccus sp. MNP-M23]|uniref:HugZ family pyridoxamine 5'-phosphate oxidase n=1 Tax=Acuticoccus sp. MNP-M23 TaxID=3072793 RepID=UPI0028157926|nr:DUF2470 domain-containing protein [Acuticoccus sp. MNP-M23]WMS44263.1 DUF2470 domain-containing protein [Acuticoccus sp. MNP-M23]